MSEPEHHPHDPNHPVHLHCHHIHRVYLHEIGKVLHAQHPHLVPIHHEAVKAHDDASKLVIQAAAAGAITGL